VRREGLLTGDGRDHSIGGGGKREEKRIALGPDLHASMERAAQQQLLMRLEHVAVAGNKLMDEPS